MNEYTKEEIIKSIVFLIRNKSYYELSECFIKNIDICKREMIREINSLDPLKLYSASDILEKLQTKIELLIKLSDFISYVGVLQCSVDNLENNS